jgi:hypothetical protein
MSICDFKIFLGGYTPGPPLTGEEKREGMKEGGGKGERMGRRRVGDKGNRTPLQFELSGNKPAWEEMKTVKWPNPPKACKFCSAKLKKPY